MAERFFFNLRFSQIFYTLFVRVVKIEITYNVYSKIIIARTLYFIHNLYDQTENKETPKNLI